MNRITAIEQADLGTTRAAASVRKTGPVRLLGWISEIADQPQLISVCVATAALGLATRNERLARTGVRMLAAELVATGVKSLIKHRVDRTRPFVEEDGGRYSMQPGDTDESRLNSFPSGHTAGAVAVARAVVRDYPGGTAAAYLAAAAIAAIQVPRCRHYPTDLAAGAAIGLVADGIVGAAEQCVRRAAE